jgi:SAM-dependent methyltransferase
MPDVRPYYADKGLAAEFYDLVSTSERRIVDDLEIYAGLAPAGGSILELGAGTGRLSIPLAERGYRVLGLDLAPAMLVQAQKRLAAARADVADRLRLRRGDMAALQLGETFDAIICPFYGLSHLPAGTAWRNVFKGVAAHLKPGGQAAFHLPNPQALRQAPAIPRGVPVLQEPLGDGRTLRLYVHERKARPEIGRYDQVIDYRVEGPSGKVERQSFDRLTFYLADPAHFALAAGLTVLDPIPMPNGDEIALFKKVTAVEPELSAQP